MAIVGFGRLAQRYYVPALRSLGTGTDVVEIAAVSDPLAASRAAAEAAFPQTRTYSDYRQLLEERQIDAILVASPPSTHLAIWNDAAGRRLPTFMEKPFVLCDELERAESSPEARGLLMPNFNRRSWPAYQSLREILLSGRIGPVERADFTLRVNVRPWCSVTRHRLSSGEGGALYDLGSSQLDLIQYVCRRKIVSLRAQTSSVQWPNDHVQLSVQLEAGLTVHCELGYQKRDHESIAIVGSNGSAWIENPNARVHVVTRSSRKNPPADWLGDTAAIGYRALRRRQSMLHYTIRASLAQFLDGLSRGPAFSPGFDDAIENAICLEAATQSIIEKRFIEVRDPAHPA